MLFYFTHDLYLTLLWLFCLSGVILFNESLLKQFTEFRVRTDTFTLGVCNGCQLMALLGQSTTVLCCVGLCCIVMCCILNRFLANVCTLLSFLFSISLPSPPLTYLLLPPLIYRMDTIPWSFWGSPAIWRAAPLRAQLVRSLWEQMGSCSDSRQCCCAVQR